MFSVSLCPLVGGGRSEEYSSFKIKGNGVYNEWYVSKKLLQYRVFNKYSSLSALIVVKKSWQIED